MKKVISPEDRDRVLSSWSGAQAKLWLYHVSLRRMAIRLARPSEKEALYIVGNGCAHITGPFVWKPANVVMIDERDAETGGNICRVVDSAAGFELRCSTAALAVGPANEVDASFEDFLGDASEVG
jgi:hypothetical protein